MFVFSVALSTAYVPQRQIRRNILPLCLSKNTEEREAEHLYTSALDGVNGHFKDGGLLTCQSTLPTSIAFAKRSDDNSDDHNYKETSRGKYKEEKQRLKIKCRPNVSLQSKGLKVSTEKCAQKKSETTQANVE
jgi:hypothetical protein